MINSLIMVIIIIIFNYNFINNDQFIYMLISWKLIIVMNIIRKFEI